MIFRGIRKPRGLKGRRYYDIMIYINDYLEDLLVAKKSDNIRKTDFDEILLNSIPNIRSEKSM